MKLMRQQYIALVSAVAVETCEGTGLFPELMIAQAIVESGDGNSLLASRYNNHFGIKADRSWGGKSVNMSTREVFNGNSVYIRDGFRVYDSLKEGFADRNRFLQVNPRYTKHGVFRAKTVAEQAKAFQAAGYATDPNYAKLLIQVAGKIKL